MPKIGRNVISHTAAWMTVALLASVSISAQSTAPKATATPHLTGTVTLWNGHRLEMKKPDGKIQKVAINDETERQVEIKVGTEITVEYRRKVSGFLIAQRILAAQEDPAAAPAGQAAAPAVSTATGSVVSWTSAALVLRTPEGDSTFFLSPSTEYQVKPLDAGLPVTVEFHEGTDGAKMATRVLAAEEQSIPEPREGEPGQEPEPHAG